MASNTSSVFNDSPPEAQSAGSNVKVNVQVAPSTVSAPSTTTDPRASGPVTPATTTTAEQMKQLAPRMEPTLDDHAKPKDAELAAVRFSRVSGVELDELKSSLTFRKSCLKRSASTCVARPEIKPMRTLVVEATTKPTQTNRRRCWQCHAKVPLTAVTCRCDYTFCNKHRYAEEHNCRFNFKQAAKRKLEEENPRCVPSKVARIN